MIRDHFVLEDSQENLAWRYDLVVYPAPDLGYKKALGLDVYYVLITQVYGEKDVQHQLAFWGIAKHLVKTREIQEQAVIITNHGYVLDFHMAKALFDRITSYLYDEIVSPSWIKQIPKSRYDYED